MQIDNDMVRDGSSDFYSPLFRFTLEAHISYFRTNKSTTTVPVAPNDTIVYNQDFFGLLTAMKILPCYHWFIMRLNDYFSPFEFGSGVSTLLLPNLKELEIIRQSWNRTNVITS
jgi:hypothetical protein